MSVYDEIREERAHQVELGYDAEHDDQHCQGQLCAAAAVYADAASSLECGIESTDVMHNLEYRWPFDDGFRVFSSSRTYMLKAAAMLVAEIERYDRMAENEPTSSGEGLV